jgi:hypothetical protein
MLAWDRPQRYPALFFLVPVSLHALAVFVLRHFLAALLLD